jgi:hypothetical protein
VIGFNKCTLSLTDARCTIDIPKMFKDGTAHSMEEICLTSIYAVELI